MGNLLSAFRKKVSTGDRAAKRREMQRKQRYAYIPDYFKTLDQVTQALRESGLESSNLILGIDFTKSNEWTGKDSFNNCSLHAIGDTPNPYEKAISIIGKTLAPFDEDNLIPCFGFGDVTTYDREVFSFHSNSTPCHGFEEVLACYRRIVPRLLLSGPTSYGPIVDAAVDIVERSGGQYHVLVIIADGQVTRSVDISAGKLSPQEEKTISSIVNASLYPLSIVLVGVGDGPWEEMKKFDDKIPTRKFDNFQFVNFTDIMSKNTSSSEKETAFALAALMEIPFQYKAALEMRLLSHITGNAKKIIPKPPPVENTGQARFPARQPSNVPAAAQNDQNQVCIIFSCVESWDVRGQGLASSPLTNRGILDQSTSPFSINLPGQPENVVLNVWYKLDRNLDGSLANSGQNLAKVRAALECDFQAE